MNGDVSVGGSNGGPSSRSEAVAGKKRKRNRTVLSCLPCKQKKIKCSRNIPCESCVKRGAAAECKWADREFEPPQQVFALDSVLDSLRGHFEGRLAHLESLLNVQSPESSNEVVKRALADAFAAGALGNSNNSSHNNNNDNASTNNANQSHKSYSDSPEPSQSGDEAAGAAFALEVLAGGDQPAGLVDGDSKTIPPTFGKLLPLEEFAKTSILAADSNARLEGNSRIPLLGFLNRRNITDSILACLQTQEQPTRLLDYFFSTTGWIYSATYGNVLKVEHEAFWEHVATGQREFDLPWLALLCIVLAIALQTQQEIKLGSIQAEDMYQLSKLCLEFAEWRRTPTRRVIQTLFLRCMYMNNDNDMKCSRVYIHEAIACAQALGWHLLGSDPSVMPKSDISVQDGSLFARENAIRMWWDLLVQDWVGLIPNRHPIVRKDQFTTPGPRNFTDEQLEKGMWDEQPFPLDVPTDSLIQLGKTETAKFVYSIYEAGDLPSDNAELQKYYEAMLAREERFLREVGKFFGKGSPWQNDESKGWRLLIGSSGQNCRRMRLHRPFMVRGYREPQRFGYSTTACVNAALGVLEALQKLVECNAPYMSIWFLTRHLLAAVTTIYIDVLHDADIGVSSEESDKKLVNMPFVAKAFMKAEQADAASSQLLGQRGRLLLQALEHAKEARRKTGGGSRQDYGRVLKEIAANVKRDSTSVTPVSQATSSPILPATASINWLDDPETRKLLASLGLLDTGNQWQPSTMTLNMNGQMPVDNDPLNITTSLDFANTFNTGFDLLESYTF